MRLDSVVTMHIVRAYTDTIDNNRIMEIGAYNRVWAHQSSASPNEPDLHNDSLNSTTNPNVPRPDSILVPIP